MNNPEKKKAYMGLYGSVAIPKVYCSECEGMSLVIDGVLACCDTPVDEAPDRYKREIEAEQKRHIPPKKEREHQLELQGNLCFYCDRRFGSTVMRKNRQLRLKLAWDHMVPYAYSQDNSTSNFVAACHVCNGLKSDRCFTTIEEARTYLHSRWQEKGYIG
jgi:5-methylcytosine-specific restriction endonuclease McrA